MNVTKDVLKNYKKKELTLRMLDEERKYIFDTYKSPLSKPEASGSAKNLSSPVERAQTKLRQNDEKRGKLIVEMTEIEDHVEAVEDQWIRSILKLRYIFGYSWKATAAVMNASEVYVRICERNFFDKHEYI